jgi:hypothetical protein
MLTTFSPQIAFPAQERRRKGPLTSFITHVAICVPDYVNTSDEDGTKTNLPTLSRGAPNQKWDFAKMWLDGML